MAAGERDNGRSLSICAGRNYPKRRLSGRLTIDKGSIAFRREQLGNRKSWHMNSTGWLLHDPTLGNSWERIKLNGWADLPAILQITCAWVPQIPPSRLQSQPPCGWHQSQFGEKFIFLDYQTTFTSFALFLLLYFAWLAVLFFVNWTHWEASHYQADFKDRRRSLGLKTPFLTWVR